MRLLQASPCKRGRLFFLCDWLMRCVADRLSPIGTLDRALDEAMIPGGTVEGMKRDWTTIHPDKGR